MASSVLIYGNAVQDARNRLRSAQISTMFDVLAEGLFGGTDGTASAFITKFAAWVEDIKKESDKNKGIDNSKARKAINTAYARAMDLDVKVKDSKSADDKNYTYDVFAIGDVLRHMGEYFENNGGKFLSANSEDAVNTFRENLRNQIAYNQATNRARTKTAGYNLTEHPDLGIFQNVLLDRSVVKYMERFYGPYIGADISGTTTDALAVLAYYTSGLQTKPTATSAEAAISDGEEVLPIATMVLQYHHSLLECGLALALSSKAMAPNEETTEAAALTSFNFYDFKTLTNTSSAATCEKALTRGNDILRLNLNRCGLVILRDAIDIEGSPYADTEIALLVPASGTSELFDLAKTYDSFSTARKDQVMAGTAYTHTDPTIAGLLMSGKDDLHLNEKLGIPDGIVLEDLLKWNSLDLENLKTTKKITAYSDLDEALESITTSDTAEKTDITKSKKADKTVSATSAPLIAVLKAKATPGLQTGTAVKAAQPAGAVAASNTATSDKPTATITEAETDITVTAEANSQTETAAQILEKALTDLNALLR